MIDGPNDPTQSGSPLPALESGDIVLSRNEIEVLCLKAARGAGMAWGLAEEAAYSAGWLARHGIGWQRAMLSHLLDFRNRSQDDLFPEWSDGKWQPRGKIALCPLALGATLCDFACLEQSPSERGTVIAGPVDQPVLMIPFLSAIAGKLGKAIAVKWQGGSVVVTADGISGREFAALSDLDKAELEISIAVVDADAAILQTDFRIEREVLVQLDALAMLTTVPTSEQSRRDAGSAFGDND